MLTQTLPALMYLRIEHTRVAQSVAKRRETKRALYPLLQLLLHPRFWDPLYGGQTTWI